MSKAPEVKVDPLTASILNVGLVPAISDCAICLIPPSEVYANKFCSPVTVGTPDAVI